MQFANLATFGPLQHHTQHGSNWSLPKLGSDASLTDPLGLPEHDLVMDDTATGPTSAGVDLEEEDCRYERYVDLVPDKETGVCCHSCSSGTCRRIFINVSGQLYETQLGTLNRFPNTLMGNPFKRRQFWDAEKGYYYLSRHAPSFSYILYYYQSGGKLFCPEDIPEDVFLSEVEFYQLGEPVITHYKLQNGYLPEQEIIVPESMWRRRLWLLFEHPSSSMAARVTGLISLLIIVLSIVNFCMESIPAFEQNLCINYTESISDSVSDDQQSERQNYKSAFFIIECICGVWFTLELVLRFISCPYKKRFCTNIMNIFDLGAVVPFYIITIVVVLSGACDHTKRSSISIVFLRVLRLFRAFRIFKLTKHSRGMQILGMTIKQSLKELSLFGIFLCIAVVFFSAAIYYADLFDTRSKNISSIPDGFWWAVVTMCTVGYGDKVPQGILGKLVGSLCVVSGVITIALLLPVVVSNFSTYYGHEPPNTTKIIVVDKNGNERVIANTSNSGGSTSNHRSADAAQTKAGCVVS